MLYLPRVRSAYTDTQATLTTARSTRGRTYLDVVGRRVSSGSDIRLQIALLSRGRIGVSVTARQGNRVVSLSRQRTISIGYRPGRRLRVRLNIAGSRPTRVRAKVWKIGAREPAAWQVSGQTRLFSVQSWGGAGFAAYLSRAKNPSRDVVRVSNVQITSTSP